VKLFHGAYDAGNFRVCQSPQRRERHDAAVTSA